MCIRFHGYTSPLHGNLNNNSYLCIFYLWALLRKSSLCLDPFALVILCPRNFSELPHGHLGIHRQHACANGLVYPVFSLPVAYGSGNHPQRSRRWTLLFFPPYAWYSLPITLWH